MNGGKTCKFDAFTRLWVHFCNLSLDPYNLHFSTLAQSLSICTRVRISLLIGCSTLFVLCCMRQRCIAWYSYLPCLHHCVSPALCLHHARMCLWEIPLPTSPKLMNDDQGLRSTMVLMIRACRTIGIKGFWTEMFRRCHIRQRQMAIPFMHLHSNNW